MKISHYLPHCFLCTVFVMTGCAHSYGPRPADLPVLVPVLITVVQEGTPLADAQVSLVPADGAKSFFSGGTTDANGRVDIHTYGTHKGAPVGKYKVVVTKETYENMEEYRNAIERGDEAAANRISVQVTTHVEAQYEDAKTTPLELEIVKGTKNYTVDAGKSIKVVQKYSP